MPYKVAFDQGVMHVQLSAVAACLARQHVEFLSGDSRLDPEEIRQVHYFLIHVGMVGKDSGNVCSPMRSYDCCRMIEVRSVCNRLLGRGDVLRVVADILFQRSSCMQISASDCKKTFIG